MNKFTEETKSLRYSADHIKNIHLISKNYCVRIIQGTEPEIIIRFHNNRFRRMNISENSSGIYMEEQMAITFYGLFRMMELMKDNVIEIALPSGTDNLDIHVETGVTGIDVDEAHLQNIYLKSASGPIRIRDMRIEGCLNAHSVSGKVNCLLPGNAMDYDVDCRTERKDMQQPFFPANPNAKRKIILRSNMYVPELKFME